MIDDPGTIPPGAEPGRIVSVLTPNPLLTSVCCTSLTERAERQAGGREPQDAAWLLLRTGQLQLRLAEEQ